MNVLSLIILYFVFMNLLGFYVMGIDKRRARKRLWRIPESTLFFIAVLGGSIGSILGMHIFRHKTRHWYFVYGMPAIFIIQLISGIVLFLYSPIQFYFI